MKKLALPLSLLALGALGLVACGGGDDERGHRGGHRSHSSPASGHGRGRSPNQQPAQSEERIEQKANDWAALFAEGAGRPRMALHGAAGGRADGLRTRRPPTDRELHAAVGGVSAVVCRRDSRAGCAIEGHDATAEFSNGKSVGSRGPAPWYPHGKDGSKRSHEVTGPKPSHRLSEARHRAAGNEWHGVREAGPRHLSCTWASRRASGRRRTRGPRGADKELQATVGGVRETFADATIEWVVSSRATATPRRSSRTASR